MRLMENNETGANSHNEKLVCIFCGSMVNRNQAWSHIDGDANMGVRKIEYFCSEEHKTEFFRS